MQLLRVGGSEVIVVGGGRGERGGGGYGDLSEIMRKRGLKTQVRLDKRKAEWRRKRRVMQRYKEKKMR